MDEDDYRDLFGGSSSEDEAPKVEKKAPAKPTKRKRDDASKMTIGALKKKMKGSSVPRKKKQPDPASDDSEGEDQNESLRKEVEDGFIDDSGADFVPEDEDDVIRVEGGFGNDDTIEDTQAELDAWIGKQYKHKKKMGRSEEEISQEIEEFLGRMALAADHDRSSNRQGQPAFEKIKMLSSVKSTLGRVTTYQMFVEKGVLAVLKEWLRPLPNGSLPSLDIRTTLYRLLDGFGVIDGEKLRTSGIGKVVNRLRHHPQETPENKDLLQRLLNKWTSAVMELNMDYRSLRRTAEDDEEFTAEAKHRRRNVSRKASSGDDLFARKSIADDKRQHARIPPKMDMQFVVRPRSVLDVRGVERSAGKRPELSKKLQNITKTKGPAKALVEMNVTGEVI